MGEPPASWDEEEDERQPGVPLVKEDWAEEDNDIKDNWFDEDQEQSTAEVPATGAKPVKSDADKSKEKRSKQKAKQQVSESEDVGEPLSPEEQRRRQQEADLKMASAAFGISENGSSEAMLDQFMPQSKEDFDMFCSLLVSKLNGLKSSPHYVGFISQLFRDICLNLEAKHVKHFSNDLSALSTELMKKEKESKIKPKAKSKPTISLGSKSAFDVDDYVAGAADDYEVEDDFM